MNRLYRTDPALHELDFSDEGFEWVDFHDWENSVISFLRKGRDLKDTVLVVCNLTPVYRERYRIGVPEGGWWQEILNSDSEIYGGSGKGNLGGVDAEEITSHKRPFSLDISLPPLSAVFFKRKG